MNKTGPTSRYKRVSVYSLVGRYVAIKSYLACFQVQFYAEIGLNIVAIRRYTFVRLLAVSSVTFEWLSRSDRSDRYDVTGLELEQRESALRSFIGTVSDIRGLISGAHDALRNYIQKFNSPRQFADIFIYLVITARPPILAQ